jgi:predicted MFS family arabinose efflux permease
MGTFAGFLLIGGASSLWMLFAGRMIDGITAGNLTIAQAYISDVTRPEKRTQAFGLIGISFGLGFLVGPAISGILAQSYGFAAPAWGAAGLSALSIVLTFVFLPDQEELERLKLEHAPPSTAAAPPPAAERTLAFGRLFSRPLPRRRLFQFFLYVTSFAVLSGGLALFLERRLGFGVRAVGYVFMLSGLTGALTQGVLGMLVKRLGEVRLAVLGFVTMAATYPLLWFATSVELLIVLIVIGGFGVAVMRPCLTTLLTKSVGRHDQGAVLGTSQSLSSLAQMIGQPLAGFLIGRGLLPLYGVAVGAIALLGALLSLSPEPAADGALERSPATPRAP